MKDKKKLSLWERYLTKEIGIEFKACLYFYTILFFYCVYRLCMGSLEARIIHMGEMLLLCYIMGYVQVYLLWNFDEADILRAKEIFAMLLCTFIYDGAGYFFGWFDKSISVTIGFACYVFFLYICVFVVYKCKRRIDDKKLNEDLKLFQTRLEKVQDKDK